MNNTKKTKLVVTSVNHPYIIKKRNRIENLLGELSKTDDSNITKYENTIKKIHNQMNELKMFNKILERRHVAAIITRETKVTNVRL